ncbi:MAG: ABC transporter ATP-binding protein [Bacteroidales bacterium]|nr:ABC transporter ATP-binding protein [Bacteroidales bacterium]
MIIQLENISKQYTYESAPSRVVLQNINMELCKGDSVAIVGPSGCGKSTLLNILGTLDLASSGKVSLEGDDIIDFKEEKLAEVRNRKIGFIFQMHHLLPQLNLWENILVPTLPLKDKKLRLESEQRALDLLNFVGLQDKIHQRPGQLSGGECQRAAVVRALINKPELILADEPTGSLDQESAEKMGDLLLQINKEYQVAIVIVTHSMELAERMEKVYMLSQGQLIKHNSQ